MGESTQKWYQKLTSDSGPHIPVPALTSAEGGWAIRESSAVRIGAQRGACLVLLEERCRVETGVENEDLKARRARQSERLGVAG